MATIPIIDDHVLKMVQTARAGQLIADILKPHRDGYKFVSRMRESVSASDAGRMQ